MNESLLKVEMTQDLWRPNQYDEDGTVIERPDTLAAPPPKPVAVFGAEDQALLFAQMAEFAKSQAESIVAKK